MIFQWLRLIGHVNLENNYVSMLKVAMDPNHTKITDYYKLLDKIESEYGSIINEVDKIQREQLTMCHQLGTEKFGSPFSNC